MCRDSDRLIIFLAICLTFCNVVHSFEPISIGLLASGASFLFYKREKALEYTYCQFKECCIDSHIPADMNGNTQAFVCALPSLKQNTFRTAPRPGGKCFRSAYRTRAIGFCLASALQSIGRVNEAVGVEFPWYAGNGKELRCRSHRQASVQVWNEQQLHSQVHGTIGLYNGIGCELLWGECQLKLCSFLEAILRNDTGVTDVWVIRWRYLKGDTRKQVELGPFNQGDGGQAHVEPRLHSIVA